MGKEDTNMQMGSQCDDVGSTGKAGSMWGNDGEWVLVYLHATWYKTGPVMVCGITEMENYLMGGFVHDRPSGANTAVVLNGQ